MHSKNVSCQIKDQYQTWLYTKNICIFCTSLSFVYVAHWGDPDDDDHFMTIWWSLYDKIMIIKWQYDDHQMGSGWCALLLVVSAWHTGGGWKPAVGELEGHILIHTRLVDEDDDDNGNNADDYVGSFLSQIHIIVPCFKNICFHSIWWKHAITVKMSFFSSTFEMCSIHG